MLDSNIESTEPYVVPETLDELAGHYKEVLRLLGEDTEREGLLKTPLRVAKAMQFLTKGYREDPKAILEKALFHETYNHMIIVKDINFYSMCEHHMLPFYGKAHVAYIPNGTITGLSKIARVVEVFARRLQVQERMTHQIMEVIQETLKPQGVMVVVEAVPSYTDFILTKINRIKEIEDHQGKVSVSEGIDSNYMDIINYAVFGLIKTKEEK